MLKDDDIAAIKSIFLNDVIDKIETKTDINGQLVDKILDKKDAKYNGDILARIFQVNTGRIAEVKASCKNNLSEKDKKIGLTLRAKNIPPMLINNATRYIENIQNKNHDTLNSFNIEKTKVLFVCKNNANRLDQSLEENQQIEYKAIFEEKKLKEYLKTIVGFANNKGGKIFFGIKDKSLDILGVENFNKMQKIGKDLDDLILSNLGCSITYNIEQENLSDKIIGILNVEESLNKPLIFSKDDNNSNIREGDIYYRYTAQTRLIKKIDLDTIIQQRKSQDLSNFMSMIQSNINSSGVDNLAILNLATGQVTGKTNAFYVDEKLISQIKFINEGSFCEKTGTPTLKLIGEVKPITYTNIKEIDRIINQRLVYLYFLSEEIDISINEIIKFQAEQQTYFPIFYFLHKGKISIKEAIEVINSIETTKKTSKENQIKRLNAREQSFSKISDVEFENFKNLINKKYNLYSKNDKESIFKFINKMDKEKITNNRAKIYEILNSIFKEYGLNDKKMFSDLRKTIRHVDEKLYKILC